MKIKTKAHQQAVLLISRGFSISVGLQQKMPAVAAEKLGICRPKGASMSDDHQLHLTLVNVDQDGGAPLCVHEEDDREDCHLKLWASPDKGTANRFDQPMPAKLEVQNVVILIRLWADKKTLNTFVGDITGMSPMSLPTAGLTSVNKIIDRNNLM